MLHLYISEELRKEMKEDLPRDPDEGKNGLDWYAGLRNIDGTKTVIVVCPETKFSFVIWNVQAEHLTRLGEIIAQGIREVLACYSIRQDFIDQLAPPGDAPEQYALTNSKMSMAVRDAAMMSELMCEPGYRTDELFPEVLHRRLNLRGLSEGRFRNPFQGMMNLIQKTAGGPPMEQPAMVLSFPDAAGVPENCTLTVPADLTFQRLGAIVTELLLDVRAIIQLRAGSAYCDWILPERSADPGESGKVGEEGLSSWDSVRLDSCLHEDDVFRFQYFLMHLEWSTCVRVARVYVNTDTQIPVLRQADQEIDGGLIQKVRIF